LTNSAGIDIISNNLVGDAMSRGDFIAVPPGGGYTKVHVTQFMRLFQKPELRFRSNEFLSNRRGSSLQMHGGYSRL
jgi:hypothetical protein